MTRSTLSHDMSLATKQDAATAPPPPQQAEVPAPTTAAFVTGMPLFTTNPENMNNLFKTAQLSRISYFQKLTRQQPEENAVIEVNNLLANRSIKDITKEEISGIEQRYHLTLLKEFKLNLEEFYAVYLNYCLSDRSLSKEEIDELKHLKGILSLD